MQGVCAGLLGEGSAALVLRWTCPSGEAPARYSGVGIVVSSSSLHWGCCVVHSGLSVLMGWREMASPHCQVSREGVCACSCSGSPLRRANNLPFCVLGFHQNHACVCAIYLPVGTVFLCFISGVLLGFKTPNFRSLAGCKPTMIPWGKVSLHCGSCQFVPVKQLHSYRVSEFMVKFSLKPTCRFAALNRFLC